MNDKQKALFKQLQLSGLGIVILVFGFIYKHKALMIIGVLVFVFGLLRTLLIKHFIDQLDE